MDYPWSWVEIDLTLLKFNLDSILKKLPHKCGFVGVVKASAYGHGAPNVGHRLEKLGAKMLAVATIEEGIELRNAKIKIPILVFGGIIKQWIPDLLHYELTPTVFDLDKVKELSKATSKKISVHLKVDTGMNRFGVKGLKNAVTLAKKIINLKNIELEGIYTHFADATNPDLTNTNQQIEKFKRIIKLLSREKINPKYIHCSNSAASVRGLDGPYNLIRPGIALYGYLPSDMKNNIKLKPVLSWYARVLQVKKLKKGEKVGYDFEYTAKRNLTIAVISLGYADGFHRDPNFKKVIIKGKFALIVGKVCMDTSMVDISSTNGVRVGDEVTIIGSDGKLTQSANDLVLRTNSRIYEILTSIGPRIKRIYRN